MNKKRILEVTKTVLNYSCLDGHWQFNINCHCIVFLQSNRTVVQLHNSAVLINKKLAMTTGIDLPMIITKQLSHFYKCFFAVLKYTNLKFLIYHARFTFTKTARVRQLIDKDGQHGALTSIFVGL